MVDTLQRILHPLLFMCFVVGLTFYPKKRLKIQVTCLNILYSLTIWFAYTCIFSYIYINFTREILFESIAMEIGVASNFLLSIISVIMSFYHQKRFEIGIKKLAAVDDTLEKLGTPKMYQKLHVKIKQIIIGWIVYYLAISVFDSIWWFNFYDSTWGLYLPYILNHCIHINVLVDLLFIFFLWYVGTRFDKVNEHIRCLIMRRNYGLRCTWEPQHTLHNNYKKTLWTTMHLHLELCHLTREINLIFTVQMTIEMASLLPYLTSLFYYLYWMIIQQYRGRIYTLFDWIGIFVRVLIFLIRLYAVNYICENVTQKANKVSKLFYQLTYIHQYADVWKEIYYFILQTMHHPLKFNGMGLFYFGYECLRQFCMTVLMYLIIMVQFKVLIEY
ncbi:uncharacterized protein LOC114255496 [Monomorium pharaonis]|uniref:uncharacterized protein LOC114255496 n=1 Tax=Monomorium pharaonis TaxID=307658 RepID=UPI001747CC44|nr:uncharacterized protein LOC114255496 [Monomorium pharaonis]